MVTLTYYVIIDNKGKKYDNKLNMYLLINLSEKDIVHLALFDEKNYQEKKYHGQNHELLECIENMIKCTKLRTVRNLRTNNIKVLKGIMCVVGSGGFTSTRIATVITNTLGFTLQIPVIGISPPPLLVRPKTNLAETTAKKNLETKSKYFQKLIPRLLSKPIGQYISPTYSGEPNIGKKVEKNTQK